MSRVLVFPELPSLFDAETACRRCRPDKTITYVRRLTILNQRLIPFQRAHYTIGAALVPQDRARPRSQSPSPDTPMRSGPYYPRLSVNPNLMVVHDAFRTRLALLQRVVPFDVARVRQLLAGAIRKSATCREAKSRSNRAPDVKVNASQTRLVLMRAVLWINYGKPRDHDATQQII
jgi:hypothetical protein